WVEMLWRAFPRLGPDRRRPLMIASPTRISLQLTGRIVTMSEVAARAALTPDQRRIVEWGDGPLVVIAGAGTGKTRVIVERVRWLLETRGNATPDDKRGLRLPPIADTPVDEPFAEPLMPEQILVLTYNVKAAKQLV